ncbi:DUF5610 domain-containing protein [Salinispirillum sp. LH 10-3-1]|uniref:DUF5610 domain-containing protein n=1 Tax=Salinispirillum sp. LH 10-3-1 TaxID=2952525 RepID=A0AB38YJU6_9GAMM
MQINPSVPGLLPTVPTTINNPAGQNTGAASDSSTRADNVNLNSSVSTKYNSPEAVLKNFDADTVIKNVSSFIERAVDRARASGASEAEVAKIREKSLAGMEKGFKDAQDIIKGLGLMSDELTSVLDGAKKSIRDMVENGKSVQSKVVESATAMMAKSKQVTNDFSFTLKTREGDVVTISASQQKSASMAALGSRNGDSQLLAAMWETNSSEAFSFSVKGDLNVEEMKAIEALLKDIGKIADKFFSGRYEQAFEKAKGLQLDSNTLASMSMNMTQTKAVAQYNSVSSGGARSEWMAPIREYAQALADLQRNQPEVLAKPAWLDALNSHPKKNSAMIDFARALMPMMAR